MSCEHGEYTNNCVCDILLDIVEAQEKVSPSNCVSGCSTALDELCGGIDPTGARPTTIPVSLICKGDCDYFVARGVRRTNAGGITSAMAVAFRVVDVDPETCCATLELLQFVDTSGFITPELTKTSLINNLFDILDDPVSEPNGGYFHSGICITVDLNCFCGVVCHPATTPRQVTV